eukprot:6188801-Pleurochrysis_carterae.AAC.2
MHTACLWRHTAGAESMRGRQGGAAAEGERRPAGLCAQPPARGTEHVPHHTRPATAPAQASLTVGGGQHTGQAARPSATHGAQAHTGGASTIKKAGAPPPTAEEDAARCSGLKAGPPKLTPGSIRCRVSTDVAYPGEVRVFEFLCALANWRRRRASCLAPGRRCSAAPAREGRKVSVGALAPWSGGDPMLPPGAADKIKAAQQAC